MDAVRTPPRSMLGIRAQRLLGNIGLTLAVFLVVSPAVFVFLWMLSLSLKTEIDNIAYPPVFIPNPPTFENYARILRQNTFTLYTWNSVVVSGLATLVALVTGVPAAYGIAKGKAAGLAMVIMLARITPGLSFLIPLFTLFRILRLSGTLVPLIITHLVITLPLVVWVMISFFEDMHPELEDAALIDGCSVWQSFRFVSLPLARPGIAVAAILAFINSWNNFLFGAVLGGRETRTLPVMVFNSLTFEQLSWGPLAASALLVTLPSLVLTILVQRHIVTGLAAGSVKG